MRTSSRPAAAAVTALAGLVLTLAGCGGVLPLGPGPAPTPAPSRLSSPIVMQPGLSQPGSSPTGCPAGLVALTGPGTANVTTEGDFTSTTTGLCYRELGKAVTFTSAGVTVYEQPAGNKPVKHPAAWLLRINLPAAETGALTALTTEAFQSRSQIAIIVAGQTWGMPFTEQPLTNGQFVIAAQSQSQAVQLQHLLLKPA